MNQDLDTSHPYKINMLMALTGLALARDADQGIAAGAEQVDEEGLVRLPLLVPED